MTPDWLKLKRVAKGTKRPQDPSSAASSPTPPVSTPQQTPSVPTAASSGQESSSPSLQERLWNRAYDELKRSDPKIIESYERILSAELYRHESASAPGPTENLIGRTQETRWDQMKHLVQAGLDRTQKEAFVKHKIEGKLQAVLSTKELAEKAIQAAPRAAVAWVGVSLWLEMLSSPVTEAGFNRRGIAYVLSKMAWYWDMASLLLDENRSDSFTGLQDELESHIGQLYQKLLLYQIRSICLYHRSRTTTVLRDVVKADNWSGQLDDIKDAEAAVLSYIEQFNTEQMKLHLQNLATDAKSREKQLDNICSILQDQTREQKTRHQDDEDKRCLRDLCVTDPRHDKKTLQDAKGGLLKDSFRWILEHDDFLRWRHDEHSRLLWIKGDPGKGKTMLLCGIIDELSPSTSLDGQGSTPCLLSYFFCQNTDSRINSAIAVLRGLIYMLVLQEPVLISHVRKEYDLRGKALFEGVNSWAALFEILSNILQDQRVESAYVIIDALDECTTDLQRLLKFIVDMSAASPRFKWIVSSRNWPDIEEQLDIAARKVRLCLELNDRSISAAVGFYISHKVRQLAQLKKYDEATRKAVHDHLSANAQGTFLWVSLSFRPGWILYTSECWVRLSTQTTPSYAETS
ncbi:hypothetical protein CDD83_7357 [Cordyceps sp. RAO-2017]|nr:hypothetical protein CDD83_7357 [Cordyceps sp. RAO-2017]